MMELPAYRWPNPRNLAIGLRERARIFLSRVGTIILALMIVLWFLSSFPAPPRRRDRARRSSTASPACSATRCEYVFAPIGFNWQISIALVPGLAAREVAVGALGTVYSLSATGDEVADAALAADRARAGRSRPRSRCSPGTCSRRSACRRSRRSSARPNSWRYPIVMAAYLFALAYVASFVTYRIAVWAGA